MHKVGFSAEKGRSLEKKSNVSHFHSCLKQKNIYFHFSNPFLSFFQPTIAPKLLTLSV